MIPQYIFPAEIICDVLSHTSPIDVVRWRRVSKRFCDITHEPRIWRTLYANARYTHPPGPFPTIAFENAFAKSAKLARTWTIRGLQTLSRVTVPFKGRVGRNVDLIDGRWFLVCQARRRFVLYDTSVEGETREPRVVWEQRARIIYWHKRLWMSEDGKWVVYVLMNTEGRSQTTLLEIQLNIQTGAPSSTASFNLPVLAEDPKFDRLWQQRTHQTCSRFLVLRREALVFDMQTHVFYGFPAFHIARPETRFVVGPKDPRNSMETIIPTNTHVILLHTMGTSHMVIQAFIVPDDQHQTENRNGILRLTHEGVFEFKTVYFSLIRSSVVDQKTGTINVKLLEDSFMWMDYLPQSTCISLMLQPTSEDVLPISVHKEPVRIRRAAPSSRRDLDFCSVYYDVSLDGYARGLFIWCATCMKTTGACVMKFSIDATGDRCVFVVGWPSEIDAEGIGPLMSHWACTRGNLVPVFDSMRGRLSYLSDDYDGSDKSSTYVSKSVEEGRSICVVDVQ